MDEFILVKFSAVVAIGFKLGSRERADAERHPKANFKVNRLVAHYEVPLIF